VCLAPDRDGSGHVRRPRVEVVLRYHPSASTDLSIFFLVVISMMISIVVVNKVDWAMLMHLSRGRKLLLLLAVLLSTCFITAPINTTTSMWEREEGI